MLLTLLRIKQYCSYFDLPFDKTEIRCPHYPGHGSTYLFLGAKLYLCVECQRSWTYLRQQNFDDDREVRLALT